MFAELPLLNSFSDLIFLGLGLGVPVDVPKSLAKFSKVSDGVIPWYASEGNKLDDSTFFLASWTYSPSCSISGGIISARCLLIPLSTPFWGSFSTEVTNAPAGEAPGESTCLILITSDFLSYLFVSNTKGLIKQGSSYFKVNYLVMFALFSKWESMREIRVKNI